MTRYGYTLMCEQTGPKELVLQARAAELAGFDFAVMSDHYFPWLDEMGHSPHAWSVLGAVAHATDSIGLMTYVTCPIKRYHPAVVAQSAATVSLLSDGRFTLGLGAGEHLNEHVTGGGWPSVNVRHSMLTEAVEIIRLLLDGGYVNYQGRHFEVDSAKVWDLPDEPPRIGIAVSGQQSCELAGALADVMIAVEPRAELGQMFSRHGGEGKPRVGQIPVCFDPDRNAAADRAHRLFRWFGGGWKVNSELPGTSSFASASQHVRREDIAESIPCGDDVDAFVSAVRAFPEAGFTDVALIQIGGENQDEIHRVERERALARSPQTDLMTHDPMTRNEQGAVLFDLDGTLLDTNYIHTLAWWRALSEAGKEVPMAALHRLIGMGSAELLTQILGRPDDKISQAHGTQFADMHDLIRPLPGAAELVRAVEANGTLVVVVTSAEKGEVDVLIDALGCRDSIDVVVHGESGAAKPAPDLFEIALERVRLDPSSAIALGDSIWDIVAAAGAGVKCVAVETGGIARCVLEQAGAVAVYESSLEIVKSFASSPFALSA